MKDWGSLTKAKESTPLFVFYFASFLFELFFFSTSCIFAVCFVCVPHIFPSICKTMTKCNVVLNILCFRACVFVCNYQTLGRIRLH